MTKEAAGAMLRLLLVSSDDFLEKIKKMLTEQKKSVNIHLSLFHINLIGKV